MTFPIQIKEQVHLYIHQSLLILILTVNKYQPTNLPLHNENPTHSTAHRVQNAMPIHNTKWAAPEAFTGTSPSHKQVFPHRGTSANVSPWINSRFLKERQRRTFKGKNTAEDGRTVKLGVNFARNSSRTPLQVKKTKQESGQTRGTTAITVNHPPLPLTLPLASLRPEKKAQRAPTHRPAEIVLQLYGRSATFQKRSCFIPFAVLRPV